MTCALIDFCGGIEKGFSSGPSGRSKWFMDEWMGKTNILYKNELLKNLFYSAWRCGPMHQAIIKAGFETSSHTYPQTKHLHYIEDRNKIFLHSIEFANNTIKAKELYLRSIEQNSDNDYIDRLYSNLSDMLNERLPDINNLIEEIKNMGNAFRATSCLTSSTSSGFSTFQGLESTVTACPDLEDL